MTGFDLISKTQQSFFNNEKHEDNRWQQYQQQQ
jgi:hypothetical protein